MEDLWVPACCVSSNIDICRMVVHDSGRLGRPCELQLRYPLYWHLCSSTARRMSTAVSWTTCPPM